MPNLGLFRCLRTSLRPPRQCTTRSSTPWATGRTLTAQTPSPLAKQWQGRRSSRRIRNGIFNPRNEHGKITILKLGIKYKIIYVDGRTDILTGSPNHSLKKKYWYWSLMKLTPRVPDLLCFCCIEFYWMLPWISSLCWPILKFLYENQVDHLKL